MKHPAVGTIAETLRHPDHHAVRGDSITPAFAALNGKPATGEVRKTLLDLHTSLAAMPKDEALAMIRTFLESGKDRPTGLSFELAKDGSLTEWPTFRTFLLDALLAIDPAAAAAIGREILANAHHPRRMGAGAAQRRPWRTLGREPPISFAGKPRN